MKLGFEWGEEESSIKHLLWKIASHSTSVEDKYQSYKYERKKHSMEICSLNLPPTNQFDIKTASFIYWAKKNSKTGKSREQILFLSLPILITIYQNHVFEYFLAICLHHHHGDFVGRVCSMKYLFAPQLFPLTMGTFALRQTLSSS